MNFNLADDIQYLKGVGPKLAVKLRKLGIERQRDLIFYWPRKYWDYTKITRIDELNKILTQFPNSNFQTIKGRIIGIANKTTSKRFIKITEAVVEDGSGTIKLIWFNQPYLQKLFRPGSEWIFQGKINLNSFGGELVMEPLGWVKNEVIVPIYPTTAGITSNYIGRLVSNLKPLLNREADEFLPEKTMAKYDLLSLNQAIKYIHWPENFDELKVAQRRLAFDELFLISLRARLSGEEIKNERGIQIHTNYENLILFIKSLPFILTDDQKKAAWTILKDMSRREKMPGKKEHQIIRPMNRLLNGDVGSGKTIVAAIAAYAVVQAGYRVVLMVPTEVLATQHFATFTKIFTNHNLSIGLLTSAIKKVSRFSNSNSQFSTNDQFSISNSDENLKNKNSMKIAKMKTKKCPEGADIVIGTHALLQKKVQLENVGLVIVDEQHRFGVRQRMMIKQLGQSQKKITPHFLSMTATPIPRTLHLALFGDLDVSVIREKPKNRKEIKTRFVAPQNRMKAYDFIRRQIKAGRQIFVICPLIEDSEENANNTRDGLFAQDKKSVMAEYEKLSQEIFPEFKAAMLHGKMKSKEKDEILSRFSRGESDILVSTSVIEVGIDIPNASVMMIEDAERFGLAQIHQFRGRVGRGEQQSFCFLFSNTRSEKALHRLKSLETISDGFKLAEIDLETRGPGEIFGTLQSGELELKMASFSDKILIERASEAAKLIVCEGISKFPKLEIKLAEQEASRHYE